MMGGNRQLYEEVLDLVEYWVPKQAHGDERKFQSELQEFLDHELNETGGNDPLGMDMGNGHENSVSKEHGTAKADVAIDGAVGIEMKRDLSNSQTKKLRGQLEEYLDSYPYVIACACGIDDMDGWRRLKNKYQGNNGLGFEGGEVAFVHKKKENYGKNPDDIRGGGGLFDGGLF